MPDTTVIEGTSDQPVDPGTGRTFGEVVPTRSRADSKIEAQVRVFLAESGYPVPPRRVGVLSRRRPRPWLPRPLPAHRRQPCGRRRLRSQGEGRCSLRRVTPGECFAVPVRKPSTANSGMDREGCSQRSGWWRERRLRRGGSCRPRDGANGVELSRRKADPRPVSALGRLPIGGRRCGHRGAWIRAAVTPDCVVKISDVNTHPSGHRGDQGGGIVGVGDLRELVPNEAHHPGVRLHVV